jgi:hypothetical protein
LSQDDQQLVPQAMQLLLGERAVNPEAEESPNPLRAFRIEVNADTMVQIDEDTEKQRLMEFLGAIGQFFDSSTKIVMQAGPMGPPLVPLIMGLLKFGVTGFKVGRQIEGLIDSTADKLAQMAANPPPPQPDPEMVKAQAEIQKQQAQMEMDKQKHADQMQFDREKHQNEMQMEREKFGMEQQARAVELQNKQALDQQKLAGDQDIANKKHEQEVVQSDRDHELAREDMQATHEIKRQEVEARAKPSAEVKIDGNKEIGAVAKHLQTMGEGNSAALQQTAQTLKEAIGLLAKATSEMANAAKVMAAPRKALRGPDGRISGSAPDFGRAN